MRWDRRLLTAAALLLTVVALTGYRGGAALADDLDVDDSSPAVHPDLQKVKQGSKTDDEVVQREGEAIRIDGISPEELAVLRKKATIFKFEAEVDRMMKLIINSLYRNKEIFLRELISNASDALDKIRLLSLTDPKLLGDALELSIKIKADKDNHVLHITDTGIGMTKQELVNNLGTIAKSGTSEFVSKMLEAQQSDNMGEQDLIGQFGVGFYSTFLVADRVVVTSKSNDDPHQWIWESDASSFSVMQDPRGSTLKRGTQISLHLKEEAYDFLEPHTLKDLVKKYSQFINFNIYLWTSKTETVEEPIEEDDKSEKAAEKRDDQDANEEAKVEEEKEKDEKPKTKKIEKTTWDWELINDTKPLWLRKSEEVKEDEYNDFYKSLTKDYDKPLAHTHFTAEGEVTFKSLLFVPSHSPNDMFNNYGKRDEQIKLYVRRVFITDDFQDMMPKYLAFVRGLVDSDDLPLNVSRETLQQHKLLKVIKKKLVRKVLDMLKKLPKETFLKFWKEYSTNIKLGVMEDSSNRTRLAKLLRFHSSHNPSETTTLAEYVERMKEKQEGIFFVAGTSISEVEHSPFVERAIKKGYEVLFLTEPVDEYCIQALPEFEGKKFQNLAKEGVKLDDGEKAKELQEQFEKTYEILLTWLKENALKDKIEKAVVSQRLTKSPCALVANSYGWSGNMERIMTSQAYAKAKDPTQEFYSSQKKIFEVNPRHPVIKELLERVKADKDDRMAVNTANLLFETSTLRSGFLLKDTVGFAERIEAMLKASMNMSPDEMPEDETEDNEIPASSEEMPKKESEFVDEEESEDSKAKEETRDEL